MKYYAVKQGKKPGIYSTWEECKAQVHGFPGAIYKKFEDEALAKAFISGEQAVPKINPNDTVAYVDGSYDVATHRFSYGAVIIHNKEEYELSEAFSDERWADMRNVAGEIRGAMAAITWATENKVEKLIIYHDYEGISRWPLGEWKTQKECTKAYVQFVKDHSDVEVTFMKVKAHSGNILNDRADLLAKEALKDSD